LITKQQLQHYLEKVLERFPKSFDKRLIEGCDRLPAHCPKHFVAQRDFYHLSHLLIFQFLLQKRIEVDAENSLFKIQTKFFLRHSRLCLIACISFPEKEYILSKDILIKTLQLIAPGISEVEGSFWRWLHPELPYMCVYMELQRLRGKDFSTKEIRLLQPLFEERLPYFFPKDAPSFFWPFNEEEAFKQLHILQSELHSSEDLPQASIHFWRQTNNSLEFLINLARPSHPIPLEKKALACLPHFTNFCLHFIKKIEYPFAKETWCFSLFLPIQHFSENNTINLLHARDQIVHYMQLILGPFRDYNGGLFEVQKRTFADIAYTLATKIPHFALFADKFFHALQPVEARITLPLHNMERMLRAISALISRHESECFISEDEDILVFRTRYQHEIQLLTEQAKQHQLVYADFVHASLYYFCVRDKENIFKNKRVFELTKRKTLQLMFLEGQPPSLSPYLSGGDIRCCVISKLLFEGLTRLNAEGIPQLAGADKIHIADGGKRFIFHLRPFNWSNGQLVSAGDYLMGWRNVLKRHWVSNRPDLLFVIKNAKKLYNQLCLDQDLGIHALNASTLQVELEYPDSHFLEKVAQPLFFPSFGNVQEPMCFNGPYVLNRYNQKELELGINPLFWDAKNIHFQQIHIRWFPKIEDAYFYFEDKKIDWVGDPCGPLPKTVIKELEQKGILHKVPVRRHFFLYLNTQHSLLRSPLVRQALNLSLDRNYICTHIFPHCVPLYDPMRPQNHFSTHVDSVHIQNIFEDGLKSINATKNRLPALVLSYAQLPGHGELARYLQSIWGETFGLTVHLQAQPWNIQRSLLEKKDFQIAGCFTGSFDKDPLEVLQRFEEPNSITNFPNWSDANYQAEIAAIYRSKAEDKEQSTHKAASILACQVPFIPICMQSLLFAKNPKLNGEIIDASGCVDFRFSYMEG